MAYSIRATHSGHVLHAEYEGAVSKEELIACTEERVERALADPRVRVMITDYTDADVSGLGSSQIIAYADAVRDLSHRVPHLHLVAVLPGPLEYGLGRMWEVHAEGLSWRTRLVRSRDEARAVVDRILAAEFSGEEQEGGPTAGSQG